MAEEEYEDEEYEEISDEEKLKIATHFLLSSPAGEIKELVNDVKNIIPSSVLNEDSIKSIFRTHNIDQQTLGETTNGDVMLVSKHGEIDDNHYVDPRAGKIYGYNHVTQVGGRFFVDFYCSLFFPLAVPVQIQFLKCLAFLCCFFFLNVYLWYNPTQ